MRPGGGLIFRATIRPVFVLTRDLLVSLLERRHGIQTSGVVQLTELGLAAPERVHYKAAPWRTLRRALPPRSVTPDDCFIDIGSGMGRVVYQAATAYPFRRVIGVELAPELNRIAEANLRRNAGRLRCPQVELVCCDVLDYEIPDDVTVVFLASPFVGRLFATVVDRLLASVERHPRPMRIIYFHPVEHEVLMATGRVRVVRRLRGMRPGREWALSNSTNVYAVLPAPPSPGPGGRTSGRRSRAS
jgi:Histone methylation protein DOT1